MTGPVAEGPGGRGVKVLRLLATREAGGGSPPSVREVARTAGYRSSRGGQRALEVLEMGGYIERGEAPSRTRRPARLTERGWEAVGTVPALGRIAAGSGIEPVREVREIAALGGFSLTAAGNSMTGAGIEDGDRLLFVPDPSPPDGTIVAALIVSGGDVAVTVKRLFREGVRVRLAAESPDHEDLVVAAGDVEVQGRLEWILRRPNGRYRRNGG